MPWIEIGEVKAAVSVWRLLEDLGWRPTFTTPHEQRGACPICGKAKGQGRVLVALPDMWRCYRCGRYGDVIDLWSAVRHVTFDVAIRELANCYCVSAVRKRSGSRIASDGVGGTPRP